MSKETKFTKLCSKTLSALDFYNQVTVHESSSCEVFLDGNLKETIPMVKAIKAKTVQINEQPLDIESSERPTDKKAYRARSVGPLPVLTQGYIESLEITDRTFALVRGLKVVLTHHGAGDDIINLLDIQLSKFLNSFKDEKVWLKHSKYVLTCYLASYLGNELPAKPTDGVQTWTPVGLLRRWMKTRLAVFSRKNTHLWYSWLQCKRSCLPVSELIVSDTYKTHLETLTKPDSGSPFMIESIMENKSFLKLLKIVKKNFNESIQDVKFCSEYQASNSACFESSRSTGGQAGHLIRMLDIPLSLDSNLVSMNFYPRVYGGKSVMYNRTLEVREPVGRDEWSDLNIHINEIDRVPDDLINCCIQGVVEPLKVRVISKGEALPYYSCKRIQLAMHAAIRKLPCFKLVGQKFCPTMLTPLYNSCESSDSWLSIDYSAATDGLSYNYSKLILDYIIDDLPFHDYMLAQSVLGPHNLCYPDAPTTPKGRMSNGQLMGSILSFPILCLANMGVYLESTDVLHRCRRLSFKDRITSVLVNGDDMLYCSPPEDFDKHRWISGLVGLEMSVGKAYVHNTYLNINSVSVHYDISKKNCATPPTPLVINFLNTGFYFNQSKVLNKEGRSGESAVAQTNVLKRLLIESNLCTNTNVDWTRNITTNINDLLNGSLPGRQKDLLLMFLKENIKQVTKDCKIVITEPGKPQSLFQRNLFLPICFGGMGVVPPPGFYFKVKPMDKALAGIITSRSSVPLSPRPIPGYEIEKFTSFLESPWNFIREDCSIPEIFYKSAHLNRMRRSDIICDRIPFSDSRRSIFI